MENFLIGEQTCKIQGKSEHKNRCRKFKRILDGIQTDCIADDGLTYDFYFNSVSLARTGVGTWSDSEELAGSATCCIARGVGWEEGRHG